MNGTNGNIGVEAEGLRERNKPLQTNDDEKAKRTVLELNALEESAAKDEADKKTYGRTPGGVVFTVPETHDMVTQLFSPTDPKNFSDVLVLTLLAGLVFLLWALPQHVAVPTFACIFIFWRTSYNLGIGVLLKIQSNQRRLVRWAVHYKLFENPATGKNPRPWLYKLLKRELETKIPKDYKFEEAPLEYNTWLVFRRVVDLILMCDFTSYSLFAIACAQKPAGESFFMTIARWITGILLVLFNLWVKLDAHRVVKDFAWYWGDFFYLIDQELTFDGVFEMAPHPMYSVGYAGYYGISLMAGSYKVLFISIAAHAAQFAFLILVENPHIEKTYNSPPPRRHLTEADMLQDDPGALLGMPDATSDAPATIHNLLGLGNLDLYRVTDSSAVLIQLFFVALTLMTPSTPTFQAIFVTNAVVWRLWYSAGIGYILNRQSEKKKWTRHFVKYGEGVQEAWRQWRGTYHLSMTLCYASFIAAAWKMYSLPEDWNHGLVLLKHVLGFSLIALQVWVSVSIYESLGEFGWFYGDFFFYHSPKLTYSGIYRFLNNPERILGLAGVWGAALITSSRAVLFLAVLSHMISLAFIQLVERPHMQKLYGRHLRQESGVVRSLRRSLPPPLRQWQGNMDKMMTEAFDFVEEFLDAAKPKLAAGVGTMVKDTKDMFQKYPARLTITRIEPDLAGLDPQNYSVTISGTPSSPLAEHERRSEKEAASARAEPRRDGDFRALMFEYGAPIIVKWTAPLNHSKLDWVGLYMVADNQSREVTKVGSQGRWVATNAGQHDNGISEVGLVSSDVIITTEGDVKLCSGEMVFAGDKLWWTQGVFEFRYHHNGKHNVMSISTPFEVRIPRFDDDELNLQFDSRHQLVNEAFVREAIENALLPVVQNCFDRDPEIAPNKVNEAFGSLVERDGKFAKRVVFAVHHMFGIEFAPEVVKADGCVRNLAWRICNAKKVLAPYAMSKSKGTSTPEVTD